MKRKGQAAMEFLMTYGWAIIVVLAAIGALAYFGVLDPAKILPEVTTFSAPIQNSGNAVVTGSNDLVQVVLFNNVGNRINITNVAVDSTGDCGSVDQANVTIDTTTTQIEPSGSVLVTNGQKFILSIDCGNTLISGDRFDSDVTITYLDAESPISRPHTGSIQGKII